MKSNYMGISFSIGQFFSRNQEIKSDYVTIYPYGHEVTYCNNAKNISFKTFDDLEVKFAEEGELSEKHKQAMIKLCFSENGLQNIVRRPACISSNKKYLQNDSTKRAYICWYCGETHYDLDINKS